MQANKQMSYEAALKRAAALCSNQEQCSSHIREKMNKWKLTSDDADKIIDLLIK